MTFTVDGTRKRSRGFTLPEVLVTITLVAILAAAVIPTIASQVKKGDPTRVGSDFVAIRGAVEQFLTDVRRYPKTMSQLTAPIVTTAGNGPLIGPTAYGALDTLRWRGPYLNKDATGALSTGFGLTAGSSFFVDSLTTTSAASCTGVGCGQKYMTMMFQMPVNDSLSILELDRQFDDGVLATGVIRYEKGTTKDTLKMLLMPIY
jgi:prepilin-type N-terminal cleavage/methylation domain-containing protein